MTEGTTDQAANLLYMHPKAARVALAMILVLAISPSVTSNAASKARDGLCSRERTKRLVRSFVRDYNNGNMNRADRRWAQEPEFTWYFVDDEREDDAENRVTLLPYLQQRISFNDRLLIRRLSVAPEGNDFSFTLRRRTDDPRDRAAGLFHGKGAARESLSLPTQSEPIPTQQCLLIVWSMDNHTE
jgi:hypothetical protein